MDIDSWNPGCDLPACRLSQHWLKCASLSACVCVWWEKALMYDVSVKPSTADEWSTSFPPPPSSCGQWEMAHLSLVAWWTSSAKCVWRLRWASGGLVQRWLVCFIWAPCFIVREDAIQGLANHSPGPDATSKTFKPSPPILELMIFIVSHKIAVAYLCFHCFQIFICFKNSVNHLCIDFTFSFSFHCFPFVCSQYMKSKY